MRARQGFTLIEMLIVAVILAIIMGVVVVFVLRGNEMARQDAMLASLEQRTMRAVELVVDDARRTGISQLIPPMPMGFEERIEFLPVVDLDPITGAPVYGSWPVVFLVEMAEDESMFPDGTDTNGNGLIDDRVLRRVSAEENERTMGASRGVVIATGVKGWDTAMAMPMSGFRFRLVPGTNRLRVALTLQKADRYGRVFERTYRSSVTLRNN